MGDNTSFSVWEEQVVSLYDLGVLTREVLDALSKPFSMTDIDAGGEMGLLSKDNKDIYEIVVSIMEPDFVQTLPDEGEEWQYDVHWDYADRFFDSTLRMWGWR